MNFDKKTINRLILVIFFSLLSIDISLQKTSLFFSLFHLNNAIAYQEKESVFYYLNDSTKQLNNADKSATLSLDSLQNHTNDTEQKNTGNFYEKAEILIIDTYNGKTKKIFVNQNNSTSFGGAQFILHLCWQENNDSYQPESKALIEINDDNNNQIFAGWILAQHRALSQTKYKNHMFFLQGCVK